MNIFLQVWLLFMGVSVAFLLTFIVFWSLKMAFDIILDYFK